MNQWENACRTPHIGATARIRECRYKNTKILHKYKNYLILHGEASTEILPISNKHCTSDAVTEAQGILTRTGGILTRTGQPCAHPKTSRQIAKARLSSTNKTQESSQHRQCPFGVFLAMTIHHGQNRSITVLFVLYNPSMMLVIWLQLLRWPRLLTSKSRKPGDEPYLQIYNKETILFQR